MMKKSFTALYADENKFYVNEDSGNPVFNCNGIGILNIDLNNVKIILMKMTLILLFLPDFWRGILNLKNTNYLKTS